MTLTMPAIVLLLLCWIYTSSKSYAEEIPLDPRAKQLIVQFESLSKVRPYHRRWEPKHGPWAAYLKRPFKEGLSPRERVLYEKALTAGDCDTVSALQSVGFLLLYPFLQPVHGRLGISEAFDDTVIFHSIDYRYCFNKWRLNRSLRFFDQKGLKPPLIRADLYAKRIRTITSNNTPENRAGNELCEAFGSLTRFAIY